MLKKSTFKFLFILLAMAGMSVAATIKPVMPNQDQGGCYLIGNAAELYGFAAIVNGTFEKHEAEPEACGELTDNIVVNENVLTSAGELSTPPTEGFIEWIPIGNKENPFQGTIFGYGHTISGLYFNNSGMDNVGLFGYTFGMVTIDGVGVLDSYFRGGRNVGSIVGLAAVEKIKTVTVKKSYNMGSVIGTSNVGGLVGKNGNVKFSYNTGSVTGTENVGGLVGSNIENQKNIFEIIDSYNVGLVKKGTGSGNFVLGEGCPMDSQTSAVRNVYYLEGFGDGCLGAFSMTSYEFADGLVANMLHNDNIVTGADNWGQVVGADKTPTLTGKIKFLLNEGCFEIASEEDLYFFAAAVNNGVDSHVCAKLTKDIVVNERVLTNVNDDGSLKFGVNFKKWIPIGNEDNPFQGTFHGQGHTISGLYFNNSETDNVGLFGYTSGAVTIDSVGVVDSYFRGGKNVGSIVGLAASTGVGTTAKELTVKNSYNMGSVIGTSNVGGLVGKNGNVKFSYNTGSVTGTENVGGLVGSNIVNTHANTFEINGSYNVGLVKKGTGSGNAVLGEGCPTGSQTSAVRNVYYLAGAGNECLGAFSMISYEFADGLVANMLHNDNTVTGADIWGQVVGADKTPMLTGEIKFLLNDGCFEIAKEDDLYLFADVVNDGVNPGICAKLTKNIVVNVNVLAKVNDDGSLKDGVNFKKWVPIGNKENPFQGTFHGQGHTIRGLYFNDTGTDNIGLFGDVSGTVTIDSVGLVDSYIKAGDNVGGLVGYARGSLTINDSYNASSVNTPGSGFGGLVGAASVSNSSLTINNSYNVGPLNGYTNGGGLVGFAYTLVVRNSYNAGSISYNAGSTYNKNVGGITSSVDGTSTVTNCFNFGTISFPTGYDVSKDDLVAAGGKGAVTVTNSFSIGESRFEGNGATKMSTDKFRDGTVFIALRSAEGGEVWRQYKNDAYPTLAAKTGTPMHVVVLHYSETDSVVFTYTEGTALTLPAEDKSGRGLAGWTTSADGTGDAITEISTSATTDFKLYPKVETFVPNAEGYYEIATADDLYKFAAIVNGGNSIAKAELTANIVVNKHVLATEGGVSNVDTTTGAYTGSTTGLRKWTPIGTFDNPFKGSFNGHGHTISGLYFNDVDAENVGLFGYVTGENVIVSISNVGVEDSYFKAYAEVGGIVGCVNYKNITLNIENVYNAATVVVDEKGYGDVGGIIGDVYNGPTLNVTNTYNVGTIVGKKVGGIIGNATNDPSATSVTVVNSYNYGRIACSYDGCNQGALVGYVGGAEVSVTNSYYLASEKVGDYGSYKTADDFANGDVFVALHSVKNGYVWVQAPGDKYPTIDVNASETAKIVVLDWLAAADSTVLEAEGFSEDDFVVVKGGKQFYADGEIYEGILSADQVDAIGENKLYPISGVKLENVSGELVATLNGNSDETLVIPTDIAVDKVVYQRDLTSGVFQTIMLPFDAQFDSRSAVKFYEFKEVTADYDVNVSTVKDKILANKPYIVVANSGITQIEFAPESGLTLVKSTSEVYEVRKGNWVMKGVYKTKVFENGDSELGRAYGFAGQQQVDTKIGEFVKVGTEAFADPMRMYLVNDPVPLARPGQNGVNSFARIRSAPKSLLVVIVDDDEEDANVETLVVKRITVAPTVVPTNRWFDMQGRALNAKPTAKGTYYYNGQRVVIK